MHTQSGLETRDCRLRLWNLPFINDRLDLHMQEVIRGASVALFLKVTGAGLAFCFNIVLARILGADGAGLYFIALTLATVASVVGRAGLDNALLRFVSANGSVGNWQAVKGVYRKGFSLALAASSAMSAFMFLAAPLLSERVFFKPALYWPIRWMSLAVVPITLFMLHAEILKGLRRVRDSILAQSVCVPAFSLAGLFALARPWGVNGAVWAYVAAATLCATFAHFAWRTSTPQLRGVTPSFPTAELFRSSTPLFWSALLNLVMMWASTLFLGMWGTAGDVGIFSVATRTAGLTSFILIAVNSVAAPKFAALYRQGDMKALASTARNSARLMTLLAAPALLLFLLFPSWVMRIFGADFSDGAAALAILAIGQFVNVATGSVGYLLIMSGHERLMRNILIVAASMCILLDLLLIPLWGSLGAAIATAVSLAFQNVCAYYLVVKSLGISTILRPGWTIKEEGQS
ncbi:MAG: oligosaccharide flippase family protein [Candidatus Abyssubacteria bacterium]